VNNGILSSPAPLSRAAHAHHKADEAPLRRHYALGKIFVRAAW
jgi:hypothetical protein